MKGATSYVRGVRVDTRVDGRTVVAVQLTLDIREGVSNAECLNAIKALAEAIAKQEGD